MADATAGISWAIPPAKLLTVVRRYVAKWERRRMHVMREYDAEGRHGVFLDAELLWMSAPVVAVAAAALLIGGHFLTRRKGRGDGGSGGGGDQEGTKASTKRNDGPLNLAQLRALRAQAAEARSSTAPAASSSSLPMLVCKVDKLEEECAAFFTSVGTSTTLSPAQERELSVLLELLTQLQLKIDGVKGDENVRSHRKTQTTRVQSLLSALEKLASDSGK